MTTRASREQSPTQSPEQDRESVREPERDRGPVSDSRVPASGRRGNSSPGQAASFAGALADHAVCSEDETDALIQAAAGGDEAALQQLDPLGREVVLRDEVARHIQQIGASGARIREDWCRAQLSVAEGDGAAPAAAGVIIAGRVDLLTPPTQRYEGLLEGARTGALLRGAVTDWTDGFRGSVSLGHFGGEGIRGARRAPILLGGRPRTHLEEMVGQLRDVATAWSALLSAPGGVTIAALIPALSALEGNRYLLLRELMDATPASRAVAGAERSGTVGDLVTFWGSVHGSFLVDLDRASHEVARYENAGGDPERVDAVMELVALARDADQPSLVALCDRFRSQEERQLFLDQLQVQGLYNRVLTAGGPDVRSVLLRGTTHSWDGSDQVLSAAEGYGVEAMLVTFERACQLAGISQEEITEVVGSAQSSIGAIVEEPDRFISSFTGAAATGFDAFLLRFPEHLSDQFSDLLGDLLGGSISIPESLAAGDLLGMVLEVLGLDRAGLRGHVERNFGDSAGAQFDRMWSYVDALIEGGPGGLWEEIQGDLSDLAERTIDRIRDWLMRNVVETAVEKLATFLVPGGALYQAIKAAWELYSELRDNLQALWPVVQALVDGVSDLVQGNQASTAAAIEEALSSLLRVALGALARWTGLDDLAEPVRETIESVRERVEQAIDRMLERFVEREEEGPQELPTALGGVARSRDCAVQLPDGGQVSLDYALRWHVQVTDPDDFGERWERDGEWQEAALGRLVRDTVQGEALQWLREDRAEGGEVMFMRRVREQALSVFEPGARVIELDLMRFEVGRGGEVERSDER